MAENEQNDSTQFDTRKRAMIDALEKSLGIVTTAAKQVGIDRTTHYVWMQNDPAYKAAVDAIADIALDFAESKLHKQIEREDTIATIFYLKCRGKKRGYIEKTEFGFTDSEGKDRPLIVIRKDPNCDPLTDEQKGS